MKNRHTILTITGSDGTGGAGVQADIKTITALGGYAVSVITSITIQNTLGIQSFYDIPADIVAGQLTALIDDLEPAVIKIGMVRNSKTLDAIIEMLHQHHASTIIYDPIVTSSQGEPLMTPDMIHAVKDRLFPLCSLVIMKQEDAAVFINSAEVTKETMKAGMTQFLSLGCKGVMLHSGNMNDTLIWRSGEQSNQHEFPTLNLTQSHGWGSSLSSAIAYYLSVSTDIHEAVCEGKSYIQQQLSHFGALKGRSSELYNEFIQAIELHCTTNNDVQFYAHRLGVSSRYLAQVTKRIGQKTPKSLIDEHLLTKSKLLLDTTSKTVQEVAYALGFHSQSHFSKFFKKAEGITPSIYRINK